jgi:hypothetical protein
MSKRKKWEGHVSRMGRKMNACRLLVGKQNVNMSPGRSRHRWVDNIKMELREIVWSVVY